MGNFKLKRTTETFREEFKEKFGDKYDLSKFEYNGVTAKSIAICPKHGEFPISAKHLLEGHGCKKCGKESISKKNSWTQEEILEKIKEIHGDKYDTSKVIYNGIFEPITLICPKHGEFEIRPHNIISGKQGCRECGYERSAKKQTITQEEFEHKANAVHNSKYDYSISKYVDYNTPIDIICHEVDPITNKEHGIFQQKPKYHLDGCGCSKCSESHLEREIVKLLEENEIEYEREKTFDWLKNKRKLRLDFYLPKYKIAIECQGAQHFIAVDVFNGENGLKENIIRDINKLEKCNKNGIKILYYSDKKYKNSLYELITDKQQLLDEIKRL